MFERPDDELLRDRAPFEKSLVVRSPGPQLMGAVVITSAVIVTVTLTREGEGGGPALALARLAGWLLLHALGSLAAAEYVRARPRPEDTHILRAQSLYGVSIACWFGAVGAVATQLRADFLTHQDPRVWAVWAMGLAGIAWSCWRIAISTAALIRGGADVLVALEANRREEEAARLRTLQYKSGPDTMLRSLSAIADCAIVSPARAEQAISALAGYVRESQRHDSAPAAPLAEEVAMTRAYLRILDLAGAVPPISWDIDESAAAQLAPTGALRTLVDYAVARCQRGPATATVTIQAKVARHRLVITVTDTAALDDEFGIEPDAHWALRARIDAPVRPWVRVETPAMLDVKPDPKGTTQILSLLIEDAA